MKIIKPHAETQSRREVNMGSLNVTRHSFLKAPRTSSLFNFSRQTAKSLMSSLGAQASRLSLFFFLRFLRIIFTTKNTKTTKNIFCKYHNKLLHIISPPIILFPPLRLSASARAHSQTSFLPISLSTLASLCEKVLSLTPLKLKSHAEAQRHRVIFPLGAQASRLSSFFFLRINVTTKNTETTKNIFCKSHTKFLHIISHPIFIFPPLRLSASARANSQISSLSIFLSTLGSLREKVLSLTPLRLKSHTESQSRRVIFSLGAQASRLSSFFSTYHTKLQNIYLHPIHFPPLRLCTSARANSQISSQSISLSVLAPLREIVLSLTLLRLKSHAEAQRHRVIFSLGAQASRLSSFFSTYHTKLQNIYLHPIHFPPLCLCASARFQSPIPFLSITLSALRDLTPLRRDSEKKARDRRMLYGITFYSPSFHKGVFK